MSQACLTVAEVVAALQRLPQDKLVYVSVKPEFVPELGSDLAWYELRAVDPPGDVDTEDPLDAVMVYLGRCVMY